MTIALAAQAESRALPAIMMTCLGYLLFSFSDALIKHLAHIYHFSQIIVLNCVVIIVCMAVSGYLQHGKKTFRMQKPKWVLLRAFLSVFVAVLNIYAFPHMHLTTFYTLVFTSPLWLAVLSALFLKEKISPPQAVAIVGGFAVIIFIFQPGSGLFNIYGGMALLSAFIYCCSMIVMRHLGPKESRTMIVISGSVMSITAMLPFLFFHFKMPSLLDTGLFIMMGAIGAAGVTAIAYAFQNAPSASTIAPYHYTQILWGALLGYFAFGEVPQVRVIVGAVFIIAAGLFLIYGETRDSKRKKAERLKTEALALAEIGEPAEKPVI